MANTCGINEMTGNYSMSARFLQINDVDDYSLRASSILLLEKWRLTLDMNTPADLFV